MLNWLKNRFKWWVAGKELTELHRWRSQYHLYRRWMAEFPDVSEALDSLEAAARGGGLNSSLPPSGSGPWAVEALRARIRNRRNRAA